MFVKLHKKTKLKERMIKLNDVARVTSDVKRNAALSRNDLIAHLKSVGQRIIDDAEQLSIDPKHTCSIELKATIKTLNSVTHVEYYINRIADPRCP